MTYTKGTRRYKKEWIHFPFLYQKGRTKVWEVATKTTPGHILGMVKWHSPWRQYTFYPDPGTLYEQDCLRLIAEFCEYNTKVHYQSIRDSKEKKNGTSIGRDEQDTDGCNEAAGNRTAKAQG